MLFAEAQAQAQDATVEHWLSLLGICLGIVVSLGFITGAVWRVWRKQVRPYMDAQDKAREEQAEQATWVREQMKANGLASAAGTEDDTWRDALDRNTVLTQSLEEHLATLGATMTEFRERLDALDHRDTRQPRLESPEGES